MQNLDFAQQQNRFTYWRTQVLTLMTMGYASYYLVRKNMSVVNKSLSDDLGYTSSELGNILALSYIVYGISKFLGGILSDRLKPRWILFIGLLVASILNLFIGLTNAIFLSLMWALVSLFQGFGVPSCSRIIANWFHVSESGRAWGVWNASHQIGGAIILVFGAVLIQHYGWQSAFIVPAIISISIAFIVLLGTRNKPKEVDLKVQYNTKSIIYSIIIIFFIGFLVITALYIFPKFGWRIFLATVIASIFIFASFLKALQPKLNKISNKEIEKRKNEPQEKPEEEKLTTLEIFNRYILKNKVLWIVCFANLFLYIVRLGVLDWGPRFLEESKGFTLKESASITALSDIAGIFGAFVCGYVSDVFFKGRRASIASIFVIFLTIFSIWLVYLPVGASFWLISLCLVGLGFFVYGPLLMVAVIASDVAEHKATGTAVGLTGLFGYLGSVIGSLVTGRLVEQYNSWDIAFYFWIFCSIIAAILFISIWHVKPKEIQSI